MPAVNPFEQRIVEAQAAAVAAQIGAMAIERMRISDAAKVASLSGLLDKLAEIKKLLEGT